MTHRDELWADMAQFDHAVADGVWDGTTRDPDAPAWYRDVRSLIHRARGPAEPHELVDEPAVVATMHRATLGETLARIPRSSGMRTLGRVVAMKAAAATTATVVSVAAAAAATTGIVATVAATVVVPAVAEHVVPMIGERLAPTVAAPAEMLTDEDTGGSHQPTIGEPQPPADAAAAPVADPVPVDDVAEHAPALEGSPAGDAPPAAPAPVDPVADEPAAEPPAEPAVTEPVAEEPVEPAPVDPAPADPPPDDNGRGTKPHDPGAPANPASPFDAAPQSEPAPPADPAPKSEPAPPADPAP